MDYEEIYKLYTTDNEWEKGYDRGCNTGYKCGKAEGYDIGWLDGYYDGLEAIIE